MPIPTSFADLSTTVASNSPAGSDNVFPDLDNYIRFVNAALASIKANTATNGWDTPYLPLAGGTMTGTVDSMVVSSLNGGQLAGLRNRVINGKFEVAQRGTSFLAVVSNVYTLDRWFAGYVTNTGVVTVATAADQPADEFQQVLRATVTTADASITAGEYFVLAQKVEGYNARDLLGKTFTLSFWMRSSKTGTHCVAFRNAAADRSYVTTYTVATANTWEFKTITVNGGLINVGTWNWTTGTGLEVTWALACGSTFQTTAGAWQTGNFLTTAAQANCLDTIGNVFSLSGVQLEVGSVATPFEHRPFGVELSLCQRYYYQIAGNFGTEDFAVGVYTSATDFRFVYKHPQRMRGTPTIAAVGTLSNFQAAGTAVFNASAYTTNVGGIDSFNGSFTVAGATAGQAGYARSTSTGAYLTVSAEL